MSGGAQLAIANVLTPQRRSNVIHSFSRTVSFSLSLFTNTGWTSTNLDLEFAFSLQNTYVYKGGVLSTTVSNPGYSELNALYQKWRIKRVTVTPVFTNNAAPLPALGTGLPLVLIAVDQTNVATVTLTDIQQYSDLMAFQLGNGATGPPNIVFQPKPVDQYANSTFGPGSNVWLSTRSPEMLHYGLKVVYDPQGFGAATQIGNCSWYFRYEFEMSEPI